MVGSLQAILHRDMASGEIDKNFWDEQGRNLFITLPVILAFVTASFGLGGQAHIFVEG